MSTLATITSTFQPLHNKPLVDDIPKGIALKLDFSTTTSYLVDLTQQQQLSLVKSLQSAFVDNSLNTQPLTIVQANVDQNLVIPPFSQGYVPLLLPNPPQFTINTTGGVTVKIVVLNFKTDTGIWNVQGTGNLVDGATPVVPGLLNIFQTGQISAAGTVALYTPPANKRWILNSLLIYPSVSFASASSIGYEIRETGQTDMINDSFLPNTTTPVAFYTPPILLSFSNLNAVSLVAGANLEVQLTGTPTAGSLKVVFSITPY